MEGKVGKEVAIKKADVSPKKEMDLLIRFLMILRASSKKVTSTIVNPFLSQLIRE